MKYKITFTGREVGAIGIFTRHTKEIEAANPEAAILKLYDTHEHLSDIVMECAACGMHRFTESGETTITPKGWDAV